MPGFPVTESQHTCCASPSLRMRGLHPSRRPKTAEIGHGKHGSFTETKKLKAENSAILSTFSVNSVSIRGSFAWPALWN